MKPYYSEDGITIYHGAWQEVPNVDFLGFDLLVTDPPYGMEFRSNYRIIRHDSIVGDSLFPDVQLLIEWARRASYIFCRWDNISRHDIPIPRSLIAWVKNNWSMGDLQHEHGRQWEAIGFFPGEAHEFITRIPDVIHADRTGNEMHPTEKPVALIKTIIAANVGEIVFDPYMGSGTTLRAAKDLGRKAIGIEICEKYCEIAAKRLGQEVFKW